MMTWAMTEAQAPGDTIRQPTDRFDPLRVVIATFSTRHAASRACQVLRSYDVGSSGIVEILPPFGSEPAHARGFDSRSRDGACLAAVREYLADDKLARRCRDWLADGRAVVGILASSFPDRDRIQELLAELGGLVLGPDGKTYPSASKKLRPSA